VEGPQHVLARTSTTRWRVWRATRHTPAGRAKTPVSALPAHTCRSCLHTLHHRPADSHQAAMPEPPTAGGHPGDPSLSV